MLTIDDVSDKLTISFDAFDASHYQMHNASLFTMKPHLEYIIEPTLEKNRLSVLAGL